jgi:hypothetical protein
MRETKRRLKSVKTVRFSFTLTEILRRGLRTVKPLKWIGMVSLVVGCNASQYGVSVEPKEAEKNIKVRMPDLGAPERDPASAKTGTDVPSTTEPKKDGELVAKTTTPSLQVEPNAPLLPVLPPVELKECPIEDDVIPRRPFVLPQVSVGVNFTKTPSLDAPSRPVTVDVGVNKDGQKGVVVGVNVLDKVTVGVSVKPPVGTPTPVVASPKPERTDCIKVGKLALGAKKVTMQLVDGIYDVKFHVLKNPTKFDAADVLETAQHSVSCTTPQSRLPIPVGLGGRLVENNNYALFRVPAQYFEGQDCYFRLIGRDQSYLNRAVVWGVEKTSPTKKELESQAKYQLLDATTGYKIKASKNVGADARTRVKALMAALIQKNPTLSESFRKVGFQVFVASKAEKASDLKELTQTSRPSLGQLADGAHLILSEEDLNCTDQEKIAGIQVLKLLARSIHAHLDPEDRRLIGAIQQELGNGVKEQAQYAKDPVSLFSQLTALWAEACVNPDGGAKELSNLPPQAGALVKELYGNCELVEPLSCRK